MYLPPFHLHSNYTLIRFKFKVRGRPPTLFQLDSNVWVDFNSKWEGGVPSFFSFRFLLYFNWIWVRSERQGTSSISDRFWLNLDSKQEGGGHSFFFVYSKSKQILSGFELRVRGRASPLSKLDSNEGVWLDFDLKRKGCVHSSILRRFWLDFNWMCNER